jgi:predicted PurR-regulated permease PerM
VKFGQWVGLVALFVSLYIAWKIRQVLLLLFLAVILATALNRLVKRFRQSGAKRSLAAALAVLLSIGVFTILLGIIVPPFIDQIEQLIILVPIGLERLRIWLVMMQDQVPGSILEDLPRVDTLIQQARPFVNWVIDNFFSLFSDFLTIFISLLLVLVLVVMLLINPKPYRQGFILLFPAFYRQRVDYILSECERSLVGWTRGILLDMVVIGIVSGVSLWLLGVPLALANGALAGIFEAIPNLGPTLSVIPPMAIALLDAPWKAGAVLVVYILIQQMEQYLLVPYVMAKQVSLLPAVTLMSQVIFALFFGFLGLLLAIPLMIVGQIWIQEVLVHDIFDKWQPETNQDSPPNP